MQNILYDDKRKTGMDDRIFAQTFEARCPFLGLTGDRATARGIRTTAIAATVMTWIFH